MKLLWILLACTEKPTHSPKDTQNQSKTQKTIAEPEVVSAPEIPFQPQKSSAPVIVQVDTSKVSLELGVAFQSQEAQELLQTSLDPVLSGDVSLFAMAPMRMGYDRPYILLKISRDQFLSIAPFQANQLSYRALIDIFRVLNTYRLHVANNADLRVFHFDLAVQVGSCRIFPDHQDSMKPITTVHTCLHRMKDDGHSEFCAKKNGKTLVFSDTTLHDCLTALP